MNTIPLDDASSISRCADPRDTEGHSLSRYNDIQEAPASPYNEHDYHQWWDPGTMSLTEPLFGTPYIQKASESGDATDARGNAQDEDSA
jgi:hypothetical protein